MSVTCKQTVDAAQIDKRAVVGDVLDDAVDDLTLFEVLHQLLALLGACLFQHGAAGDDDVAAAAIHFQNLERLIDVHQRRHVADRPDVDLRTRQEGHGAVEIDGEAALDLVEDDAGDLLVVLERGLQLAPAFLPPRLVAREHRFAERVFHALQIDFHLVADLQLGLPARTGEFPQRHAPFGFQADVDDGQILFDADDLAFDDRTFLQVSGSERLVEQLGKIFTRGGLSGGHGVSCKRCAGGLEWRSKSAGRRSRKTFDGPRNPGWPAL